jgi:hypothetical protein
MGMNCAPLLADLFLYSYEMKFIQKLLHKKKTNLLLWPTIRQFDISNVLSLTTINSSDKPIRYTSTVVSL